MGRGGEDDKGRGVRVNPAFQRASELLKDKVGSELSDSKGLRPPDISEAGKSVWEIIAEYERDRPAERKREHDEIERFNDEDQAV